MLLDACARLHLDRRRRLGSYRVLGTVGYAVGLALTTLLALHLGLGVAERVILAIVPPASLLVAVKASELLFGHERIVFYEKAVVAVSATALAAFLAGGRVAACVDLATLGVGVFLGFGRIGCLMVGCCHGRPARRGIRYGHEHADAGFARRLVGRPLFPVQLVDSAVSLGLAVVGVVVVLGSHRDGDAAVLWLSGYGAARFVLELLRGDALRPQLLGVTEAQWTAAGIALLLAALRPRKGKMVVR